MITYDGLRVLMMAEDDSKRLSGAVKCENKTLDVFLQGAFDCHAPGRRNTIQNLINNRNLIF